MIGPRGWCCVLCVARCVLRVSLVRDGIIEIARVHGTTRKKATLTNTLAFSGSGVHEDGGGSLFWVARLVELGREYTSRTMGREEGT
jgi:hypothetical protein